MKLSLSLAATTLAMFLPCSAQAFTIETIIVSVPDDRGGLDVALCRKDKFLKMSCALHIQAKIITPETIVTLGNVPPGV